MYLFAHDAIAQRRRVSEELLSNPTGSLTRAACADDSTNKGMSHVHFFSVFFFFSFPCFLIRVDIVYFLGYLMNLRLKS